MKSFRYFLVLLLILAAPAAFGQSDSMLRPDSSSFFDSASINPRDTAAHDTLFIPAVTVVPMRFDSILFANHPFFRFSKPVRLRESVHTVHGREELFYCVMGLLLLFASTRSGFPRYLSDLFRLFFRASLRQRQAKEQLQQSPLPSFLMNLLFFGSAALFLNLAFNYFRLGGQYSFWILLGYTVAGLAALYIGKYLVLRLLGWIFRIPDATDSYVFIVFTSNKILGILLLPVIVLQAFTGGAAGQVAMNVGLVVAGSVFAYRYFLSYITVQRQVRLPLFHFLLYLLAFELAPLLLINKLLFRLLG
jgi:hypothetical protein